jgi:hypothetical protein
MQAFAHNAPRSSKRIAVLFHRGEQSAHVSGYIVDHLAQFWREDGHEVTYLFGTKLFVPADLIFVHVNLSLVPDEYLEFASRYPVAVNGLIRDIRKSSISRNLLRPNDPWSGPVVVKSDLNYAGVPERLLGESWLQRRFERWKQLTRRVTRLLGRAAPFSDSRSYLVFDTLADVPEKWFHDRNVVVERFRPETENGLYHLRMYQFLGDRMTCTRLASPDRILKAQGSVRVERIEPHSEIVGWRRKLGMDYGKLDYVINEREVVLLDANKTTGASRHMDDKELMAMRRYLADGIYSFFR